MSESLEILALRRQVLLARSTLDRLRVRHDLRAIRSAMTWRQAAVMALPPRTLLSGLVIAAVPNRYLARWLTIAARVLLVARVAGVVAAAMSRPVPLPTYVRQRTDRAPIDL